jgi:hypothetical protein
MEDRLNKLKETSALNKIHFDRSDQNNVFNKIASPPTKQSRWFKGFLGVAVCLGVLAFALFQVVPNHFFQNSHNARIVKEHKSDENVKTIQNYLKNEFTGPSDELKKLLKGRYSEVAPSLNQYIAENYKDLVAENNYQTFINTNEILRWLQPATSRGFQLKPIKIEVKKVENIQAQGYTFKVTVEYSKDGKSNSTIVSGYINMNAKGKIIAIRDVKDKELIKAMMPPPPKK